MKIAVVTDSGTGLNKKEAEELGLFYLPLQILDGEEAYLDGVDVTYDQIFQYIKEGRMMKTSMPPIGMIYELFNKLIEDGYDHVITVMLTSGLSSTMHTVHKCAEELKLPITSVECFTTCHIQKYLACAAQRLVEEGVELDEILFKLDDCIKHSNTLIIPDDLDHLKQGGRLTPLAAALGGMLKIKPILQLNQSAQGKIDTFAKVRTMSKALKQSVDTFSTEGIDENYELIVLHTDAPETAEELKSLYFGAFPNNKDTHFGLIGPVISVHTGIGCVGLQYIKKI